VSLIFNLTVRQLAGQRRILVVLLLAAAPVAVAAVFRALAPATNPDRFSDNLVNQLVVAAVLPISVLIAGTMAFGHEVEDRTLSYLVLKPVPRWQIALPKLGAAIAVGGVPVIIGGFATMLLMPGGDVRNAAGVAVALLAGAAAYAAVFTLAGLVTQHALAFGLIYIVLWEGAVAQFLAGVKYLSVRQYTLAIIDSLAPDRLTTLRLDLVELPAAAIGAVLVAAGFFALTVYRLRTMDYQ
jgi:ABC-2 type transport system permease protein